MMGMNRARQFYNITEQNAEETTYPVRREMGIDDGHKQGNTGLSQHCTKMH